MSESIVDRYREVLAHYLPIRSPYYTVFPSPGLWSNHFTEKEYLASLSEVLSREPNRPLQLYIHFPYCDRQCFYCQCFQKVSHDVEEHRKMVDHICQEIDLLHEYLASQGITPHYVEVHLGGGSPSHLNHALFQKLIDKIKEVTDIRSLSEFAIEIDPRTVNHDRLRYYHDCGINRISFGVQDINPEVQKAINRIQPIESVAHLLELRGLFKGVNFDLIHGLPKQTRKSLQESLKQIFALSPDRIAFSILGHRPDVFKHNQQIKESDLPTWIERARMWEDSLPFFIANGYELIGMDHFAKEDDELNQAKRQRCVYRNLMGYSPGRFEDTIAVGPSGMTQLANYYFGNVYDIKDYYRFIDDKQFPILRGFCLNPDQVMRREIMNLIMLYYFVDYSLIERKYQIDFRKYFSSELKALEKFAIQGILVKNDYGFMIDHSLGYYFLRHVCAIFDNLNMEYRHNIETGLAA